MRKIVFDFKGIEQEPIQNNSEKKQAVQKDNTEEMFEYINSVMENESYGIGLHSTQGDNVDGTLESTIKNEVSLVEYKESIFRKLINKIKNFWCK